MSVEKDVKKLLEIFEPRKNGQRITKFYMLDGKIELEYEDKEEVE